MLKKEWLAWPPQNIPLTAYTHSHILFHFFNGLTMCFHDHHHMPPWPELHWRIQQSHSCVRDSALCPLKVFSEFLLLGTEKGGSLLNTFYFQSSFKGPGVKIRKILREGSGKKWKAWDAPCEKPGGRHGHVCPISFPSHTARSSAKAWRNQQQRKKAEQREERETTHRVTVGKMTICSRKLILQGSCEFRDAPTMSWLRSEYVTAGLQSALPPMVSNWTL